MSLDGFLHLAQPAFKEATLRAHADADFTLVEGAYAPLLASILNGEHENGQGRPLERAGDLGRDTKLPPFTSCVMGRCQDSISIKPDLFTS